MGWFSKEVQKTDVELLKEKSNNVINIFTQTATQLREINQEIEDSRKEKIAVIQQLEGEVNELGMTAAKNASVVDKIEKIFE